MSAIGLARTRHVPAYCGLQSLLHVAWEAATFAVGFCDVPLAPEITKAAGSHVADRSHGVQVIPSIAIAFVVYEQVSEALHVEIKISAS